MTRRTGVRLRTILARWFDAAAMERFIDPVLADLQSEYEEAVRAGRRWHSRRIWLAGHVALGRVLAWHGLTRGGRGLIGVGEERRAMNRTLAAFVLFTAAAAVLFIAPFLAENSWELGLPHAVAASLAMFLAPQALATVLPFSLMCAILWGLGRAPASRRLRIPMFLLAATASLGAFVMWAWVVPASNQAYRTIVFEVVTRGTGNTYGPVPKGLNELTLTELRQIMKPPTDQSGFVSEDARRYAFSTTDHRRIAGQYHRRVAFGWSPLVLAAFALAVTARRTLNRWWLGAAGAAAIAAYVLLQASVRTGFDGSLPAAVVAWAPNAAFLLASIVISTTPRRVAS